MALESQPLAAKNRGVTVWQDTMEKEGGRGTDWKELPTCYVSLGIEQAVIEENNNRLKQTMENKRKEM